MSLPDAFAAWNAVPSGPFFDIQDVPDDLLNEAVSTDYLQAVQQFGGREGFLGRQYLRLYRRQELVALNQAYQIPDYNRQLFMFGADGHGDAFGFVIGTETVVNFPLIPIPTNECEVVADGFTDFLDRLMATGQSSRPDPGTIGKELHLKQPLCFGGDFRDPENLVMVDPMKHAELARYWNRVYYDSLAKQKES